MRKILVTIENVSMSFGARDLFSIKKLEIHEGDKIGLVGLNGSGKTTLLKLINGDVLPDEGILKLNCTPRYFMQLSDDHTAPADLANPKELNLFGVQNLMGRDTTSGGESTRLRLAETFSENGSFFLLDEPTSHLDAEGFEYLDQRLSLVESFVLVSHDRELLDRRCNTILEIENGTLTSYPGSYSSYRMQKKQAIDRAAFEYEPYTDEVKRLSAAYRQKKEQARKAENLSFSYPDGREIFKDTHFSLLRGSRTVLLGKNGAGKTTLIRLIMDGALVRIVPKARIGYLMQDLSDLNPEKTVLESATEKSIQQPHIVRIILARLLFKAPDLQKSVAVLSGGERVRLAFARILVSDANVLILDEPTNYLDIPSIEAIQTLLSEYEGTMLFTSHDQSFVNVVATNALLIRDMQILPVDL